MAKKKAKAKISSKKKAEPKAKAKTQHKSKAKLQKKAVSRIELATFAAGCFWHVQDVFDEVKGVVKTTVGYTGGTVPRPTYEQVCTNTTGHAESVLVEFDPSIVSYEHLLDVFWNSHNPTTRDRQGLDFGKQYRSAIFYHSERQKLAAEKAKAELEHSGRRGRPIVTEITQAGEFYPAEEYHQHYHKKNKTNVCGIQF